MAYIPTNVPIFLKRENKDKLCNSPCNGQYCNSHEKIINKKK